MISIQNSLKWISPISILHKMCPVWRAGLVTVLLFVSACSAAPTGSNPNIETTIAAVVVATQKAAISATAVVTTTPFFVAASCPKETAITSTLLDQQNGYCLTYPKDFSLQHPYPNVTELIGPALDKSLDPLQAQLLITNEGAVNNRTLDALADEYWRDSQVPVVKSDLKLGDESALAAENVQMGESSWKTRQVVSIHNGIVYHLTFSPVDGGIRSSQAAPDIDRLWKAVTSSFTFIDSGTVEPGDLTQYEWQLTQAIMSRQWDKLKSMMSNPFNLYGWQTEGQVLTPDEALEKLRTRLMASTIRITCDKPQPESLKQLLGGSDAYTMFDPNIKVSSIYTCQGWGKEGYGQALVIIALQPDNTPYWYGVLAADYGFQPSPGAEVKSAVSAGYINLRSGPGVLYTKLGPYAKNTSVTVLGKVPGGGWVLVKTPDDKMGWMSVNYLEEIALANVVISQPNESFTVTGKVVDKMGDPISEVAVAVWQDTPDGRLWNDATSDIDGIFYVYLPKGSEGSWSISIVSADCKSRITDEDCKTSGSFVTRTQPVEVPQKQNVTFIYDPDKTP